MKNHNNVRNPIEFHSALDLIKSCENHDHPDCVDYFLDFSENDDIHSYNRETWIFQCRKTMDQRLDVIAQQVKESRPNGVGNNVLT